MKYTQEQRAFLSKELLSEFELSEEKNKFFYLSYIKLLDCPDIIPIIKSQLFKELDLLKQSGILSTNLYNPNEDIYEFKNYQSIEVQNLEVERYKAKIEETCNLITSEAATLRFIENNHDKPVHRPSLDWYKFLGLKSQIARDSDVKKLFEAFEKNNRYSHFFNNMSTLKKAPKLAQYIHDCLTASIEVVMRSYKQVILTYDPDIKKTVNYSFGSYSSRNEFLTKLKKYLDSYLEKILKQQKKQSQPGDE